MYKCGFFGKTQVADTEMENAAKGISDKFESPEDFFNEHHSIHKECSSFYTDCGIPVLSSIPLINLAFPKKCATNLDVTKKAFEITMHNNINTTENSDSNHDAVTENVTENSDSNNDAVTENVTENSDSNNDAVTENVTEDTADYNIDSDVESSEIQGIYESCLHKDLIKDHGYGFIEANSHKEKYKDSSFEPLLSDARLPPCQTLEDYDTSLRKHECCFLPTSFQEMYRKGITLEVTEMITNQHCARLCGLENIGSTDAEAALFEGLGYVSGGFHACMCKNLDPNVNYDDFK